MSEQKQFSVFDPSSNNTGLPFFGDPVSIQRYDIVAWPFVQKWYEKGLSQFWRPEEVDITKDKADYATLTPAEKRIYESNLKRQTMLDSIQGAAPFEAFGPWASTPEMQFAVLEWTRQEAIHSLSYTHILRNTVNDPGIVFDHVLDVAEIVDCAHQISTHYDDMVRYSGMRMAGRAFTREDMMNAKRAFWRALFAANTLEGIRFYVSFACSWAFTQFQKKMEGNAKIIRQIARDEQDHLILTQTLLNRLPGMDPDFEIIREELRGEMTQMFLDVGNQEKQWADYLFQDGSMLGLNAKILHHMVDWLLTHRMGAIGHPYPGEPRKECPVPWINEWLNNKTMQYALQEAEAPDYLMGVLTGSVSDGLKFA
ncbi:ribonucleotide reductase of class Ia (aerobic), beta subunit [Salmonella phage P46FS4]|uniref:ribonucleoside-diphosphate reductase n=1 Tax=Salmonella phage P46FS4 TaxID=2712940 RepID=A0A6G6XTK5_9CAUD|nr:ribonucleotide reductase class Ia beta subunit [Salmonella phage P46FS4]QIG62162.1 ribonucleotide reductase of class Ia (aerobic), beta subunit [Salmonella phage P46FS4]WKM80432.1 ribonucleotide reductase of class Ia (aerobic), beta subunit [Salmonella phage SW16-7]